MFTLIIVVSVIISLPIILGIKNSFKLEKYMRSKGYPIPPRR